MHKSTVIADEANLEPDVLEDLVTDLDPSAITDVDLSILVASSSFSDVSHLHSGNFPLKISSSKTC